MVGPHSLHGAETIGSLDVANNTYNNHGWGLKDGHGLNSLLLVQLGSGAFNITDDVGHAGFVSHESS